jgi:hypothetical protein
MSMGKRLSVAELRQALALLPHDYHVATNEAGNLAVFGLIGEYTGFIDFKYGTYERADPASADGA